MLANIFAFFSAIKELVALIRIFLNWRDEVNRAAAQKRERDRNQAVDEQKNAKDEEQFDHDQDVIAGNQP